MEPSEVQPNSLVADYSRLLDELEAADSAAIRDNVLELLLLRDRIASSVESLAGASSLSALALADRRLRQAAPRIMQAMGPEPEGFETLRTTRLPDEHRWWWRLDQLELERRSKADLSWSLLALILFPVALALAVETSSRLLSAGVDFVGLLGSITQSFLALLGGLAITETGRDWVRTNLSRLGLDRLYRRRPEFYKGGLAVGAFALVSTLWLCLPLVAVAYNNWGHKAQESGDLRRAVKHYRRALDLDVNYAEARYNLATVYEDLGDVRAASTAYRASIEGAPEFLPSYNNLARLYITGLKEYGAALRLLNEALRRDDVQGESLVVASEARPTPAHQQESLEGQAEGLVPVRYFLFRNRAWAYLEAGFPNLASYDLERSLAINPRGATAHCLFARIHEGAGSAELAAQSWERCLRYALQEWMDPQLLAQARSRALSGPIVAPAQPQGGQG